MRSKTLLIIFLLILLVSGVVAISGGDTNGAEKVRKVIDSMKNYNKEIDVPAISHNTGKEPDDAEIEYRNLDLGSKITSSQAATSSQAVISLALKGPSKTDLQIQIPQDVTVANKIQVNAYYANGTIKFRRNYLNKLAVNGVISLPFDDLSRGEKVDVRLQTDRYGWLGSTAIVLLRPDITIAKVSIPGKVPVGSVLPVNITIQEINGDMGAKASVSLTDGITDLDTKIMNLSAGGTASLTLSTTIKPSGNYNLSIRITGVVPADYNETNNVYNLVINPVFPKPMSFSSNYYYQNTSLYRSRYITGSDYEEKGEEQEFREDEVISFTASSGRSLTFPLRVNISILNETGEGLTFKELDVVPTSVEGNKKIFMKHYDDSETVLIIGVNETGVSVNIEGKSNSSLKHSSGYKYWWFGNRQDWDVTTNSGSGKPVRAMETLNVRIELEDSLQLLGGGAVTIIGNASYTDGWVNTNDGRVEEQRTVWIYSGAASGDTVI